MLHGLKKLFPESIEVERNTIASAPAEKGAYLLAITLERELRGRFAHTDFTLANGTYFYAGSAYGPGGIAARLARHFRQDKKPHWHVDQLTLAGAQIEALAFPGGKECLLVEMLTQAGSRFPLPGFGSSDCTRCTSHLLTQR